jgi:hypothetical protein
MCEGKLFLTLIGFFRTFLPVFGDEALATFGELFIFA